MENQTNREGAHESGSKKFHLSLQMKTLLRKNYRTYRRKSSLVVQEIWNLVLYYGILVGLALTVTRTQNAPVALDSFKSVANKGYFTSQFTQQCYNNYGNATQCFIGFADGDDGCSPALEDFVSSLPFCGHSATDMLNCTCVSRSAVETYEAVREAQLVGAVTWADAITDAALGTFTMHVTSMPSANVARYTNPQMGPSYLSDDWDSSVVPMLAQLSAAIRQTSPPPPVISEGVDVQVQRMGAEEYETTGVAGLLNYPFYMTIVFSYGVLNLVYQVAEEREKKLDQGLYMAGLAVSAYWRSWYVVGLIRQLFTVVLGVVVTQLIILEYANWVLILVVYAIFSLYTIAFALTLSCFVTKAKYTSAFLLWGAIICTAPVYANVSILFDTSQDPVIPREISLLLSAIFGPFSFGQQLFILLLLDTKADGGVQWGSESNFWMQTRAGGEHFSLMIASTALMHIVFFFAVRNRSGHNAVGALWCSWKRGATRKDGRYHSSWTDGTSQPLLRQGNGTAEMTAHSGHRVAVSIRKLKKSFGEVHAVNGLTVDFYEGQITSFLGHNGAGKSTTIQLLTGLHAPTDGDAFVYDQSIVNEMPLVRRSIGVCPQENVLWDLLTCREHVYLFAGLRGIDEKDIDVESVLREVGLSEKTESNAKDLSGGQKRKLQVALALVFLDEPTAGMDSQARRDVWALLSAKKRGRAIVLTTHHMDEADVLGDRIAVIDQGQLQEIGTSEELKARYAEGHHVEVAFLQNSSQVQSVDRAAVIAAVRAVGGGAEDTRVDVSELLNDDASQEEREAAERVELAKSGGGGDLSLLVPLKASTMLSSIFAVLDAAAKSGRYGVRDYGIVSTTLDDVFCRLGEEGNLSKKLNDANASATNPTTGAVDLEEGRAERLGALSADAELVRPSLAAKIQILLGRRFLSERRNPTSLFNALVLPLLMVAVCIVLLKIDYYGDDDPPSAVALSAGIALAADDKYGSLRFELPCDDNASVVGDTMDVLFPQFGAMAEADSRLPLALNLTKTWEAPCFEAWLIGAEQCNGVRSDDSIDQAMGETVQGNDSSNDDSNSGRRPSSAPPQVGAIVFDQPLRVDDSPPIVRLIYNSSNTYALPGLITYTYDALMHADASAVEMATPAPLAPSAIEFPPAPKTPKEEQDEKLRRAQVSSSFGPMVLVIGFLLMPSQICYDMVVDRVTGAKHLQTLMGVRTSEYWGANMAWDMGSKMLVTVSLTMVALVAVSDVSLGTWGTFVLLTAYLFAVIPSAYLLSFAFENPKSATGSATAFYMLGFFIVFLGNFTINVPSLGVSQQAIEIFRYVGMGISPAAALGLGLTSVVLSDAYDISAFSTWNRQVEGVDTALAPLVFLLLQGVVCSTFVLVWERNRMRHGMFDACYKRLYMFTRDFLCCQMCARRRRKLHGAAAEVDDDTLFVVEEDDDVRAERAAVDAGEAISDKGVEGGVRLIHLHKKFLPKGNEDEGTVAVADMCVRMAPGECFALLGTNGAGKSTTLNMILRQCAPTSGTAFIGETDVATTSASDALFLNLGYCPQHNALFERLTGRELLDFFAAVRGIPAARRAAYVEAWITIAELTPYADRPCETYSGGNKRKLSLAIALCGDPLISVLDEPSAGVDPAARRKLWRVVHRSLSRGRTVVLTTHHMGEAAHLGHRIGIMVKGRLTCLGSGQHLKTLYGSGYDVAVTMRAGYDVGTAVLSLLRTISCAFAIREHPSPGYVKVSIGKAGSDFDMVRLFKELEAAKSEIGGLGVESFVASQSSLEQVFMRFASLAGDGDGYDGAGPTLSAQDVADTLTTFDVAIAFIHRPLGAKHKRILVAGEPSAERKLKLYALYMQATRGNERGPRPWGIQVKARMKWEAWNKLQNSSREEARNGLVDEVRCQIADGYWWDGYAKSLPKLY